MISKALEASMNHGSRPASGSYSHGSCTSGSRPQSSRSRPQSGASVRNCRTNGNKNNNNSAGSDACRKGSCRDDVEDEGISFLSVPNVPFRRPSTADVMIEKFRVERNDGGGLLISGVALSPHCHLTLIICGAFCLLAGSVLTYVAFGSTNNASYRLSSVTTNTSPGPSLEAFKSDHRAPEAVESEFQASETSRLEFQASETSRLEFQASETSRLEFQASETSRLEFQASETSRLEFQASETSRPEFQASE
ncbi:hypothetical protein FHG87_022470, partial [Trinorchestia longiramus]